MKKEHKAFWVIVALLLAFWWVCASQTPDVKIIRNYNQSVYDAAAERGIPVIEHSELKNDPVSRAVFDGDLGVVLCHNGTELVSFLGSSGKIIVEREKWQESLDEEKGVKVIFTGIDKNQAVKYCFTETYPLPSDEENPIHYAPAYRVKDITKDNMTFGYNAADAVVGPF